jgi:hypothetical protein
VVKISMRGKCKDIQLTPSNGNPARCVIRIELDHSVPLSYSAHDMQFFVPAELGTLLEVGSPVSVTLEQNEN